MKPGKQKWAALRFRQKIRNVLLTYYLTPILLILLASGWFFYYSTKKSLDEEMGRRLSSIALAAASHVRAFHLPVLELKDPQNVTYQNLLKRFEAIRDGNKVARVYLFNLTDESLLDTDSGVNPGSVYERNRINLAELETARAGSPAASVLFQGADGAYYKSAFAPVVEEGKVIALVGVDGSATFFAALHQLGKRMVVFAFACVGAVVLASMLISRKIVTPIQSLVAGAERIGEGRFDEPIELRSGNEIGFLGFVLDEMRKSIVARDRELQVMLRGIAHEVRNPLGGMELFAGILAEETKDPKTRESVARIQREIKTLQHLVEEFLDFARGPALQISSVEIHPFFDDVRVAFLKEFRENGIDFRVSLGSVQKADFDPDQMRRVFLNVVRNSVEAMPDGGAIDVRARAENGQIELSVSDTGVGIPAGDADKLFDPFFTTKEQGTGLGLSFVRKIVNAHAGEVRVASAEGGGTTVTVVLPGEA